MAEPEVVFSALADAATHAAIDGFLDPLGRAAVQDDRDPLGSERPSGGVADALRRAADERPLACELERRRLVARTVDPEDGRYTLASLTDLGREEVETATPGHVETVRRLVLQPLTKAQHRQLQDICRRILSAADVGQPWRPPST